MHPLIYVPRRSLVVPDRAPRRLGCGCGMGIGAPPPWTPAALGSALVGFWRADQGITLVDGLVSAWADQSGNAHHLLQTTAANRPVYSATGNEAGGPMISFALNRTLAATFALGKPAHAIIAYKKTRIGSEQWLFNGVNALSMVLYQNGAPQDTMTMYAGNAEPTVNDTANEWHIIDALYNGASSKIGIDGGTQATGNSGTTVDAGGFVLNPLTADGTWDVVAIILSNRELNPSERSSAVQCLKDLAWLS